MAVCDWCKGEMSSGVPCTLETYTDMPGAPYQRIPYGDSREGWGDVGVKPPPNCHDCAAPVGSLHHPGCGYTIRAV